MRYDYDMLGTRIHQASMEAGERWMLNDVTGKPIRAWDSRESCSSARNTIRCAGRSRSFVQGGDPAEAKPGSSAAVVFERTIYGDNAETGLTEPQQRQVNLRGKVFRHFDSAAW